jgi:hypothetical protein
MLRSKDSSLLDLPPPPSDAESDCSSSQKECATEDDKYPSVAGLAAAASGGIANAPMREKNEQDAVSQSINDELSKVMKLLGHKDGAAAKSSEPSFNVDDTVVHIGNVKEPALDGDTSSAPDGVNVLIEEGGNESVEDEEDDENDPLKLMSDTLGDCIDILEKAKQQHRSTTPSPSDSNENKDEEEESSLVTQRLDD